MWKKYPYAIFDMDGTLLDSMPFWHSLGRDYLISQGKVPEDDLEKVIGPMSLPESAAYFISHYHVEGTTKTIIDGINAMMQENYDLRIPAKPGVNEYLKKLQDAGVTMCICSSTSLSLVDRVLTRLEIRDYFSFLVSCDEVGVGKDRPDAYILTLQRLGARAEECAVYEDAFFAIKTANEIGLHVIGVFDSSCKKTPEEVKAYCEDYIRDFRDAVLNF